MAYNDFQNFCNSIDLSLEGPTNDAAICSKRREDFCGNSSSLCERRGPGYGWDVRGMGEVRAVLLFLLPLLFMVVLRDAYMYNRFV